MAAIPHNSPFIVSPEIYVDYLKNSIKFSGDGPNTKKCHSWFEERLSTSVLLTTSCTHALEMMAILIDIQPDDEVIMPSYTFVSTANAFAIRGAKIVFVDIRPDTMNLDEKLVERAITSKTKAIMAVHYAGVSCDMSALKKIADKHQLYLLEDAAQGMMSTYDGIPLGTIGHMGAYSFHETKNYHCGEGGLLIINDKNLIKNAEIVREKGTDRTAFFRGEVDKYTWQMIGSSYLPSELNAAYLYAQLMQAEHINDTRLKIWQTYYDNFKPLTVKGVFEIPTVPDNCKHNGHMFYIKLKSLEQRNKFIMYMKDNLVMVITHYVPLHSAPAGGKYSRFSGEDNYTTRESERLVRLPLFYDLSQSDLEKIIQLVIAFIKFESIND